MRNITIQLFRFSELSEEAQKKAIKEHIAFEIAIIDEYSIYWETYQKVKEHKNIGLLADDIYRNHRESIIATIEANEYEFLADGNLPGIRKFEIAA